MKKNTLLIISISLLLVVVSIIPAGSVEAASNPSDERPPEALVLTIQGPISPILLEYLSRGLEIAEERSVEVVILQINTPGGSVDLMNLIVQKIRSSEVPIVVYVSPKGAMAASAGTIITVAGHLSAMAPETTIGAASPVGSQGEDIGETMESKTKEILKASVRAIMLGRNPKAIALVEETIETARAVSVDEAFEIGLVDFQSRDIAQLLEQLDGIPVQMNGETIVLHTKNAVPVPVENTFIEQLLLLLTNPNIVFLLLSIGVQAVLIELSNPGGWVAGFVGAVCLLLATYGLGILPVNWFGLLFIAVAFVLFVLDIKAPTHGALTITGAVSFITGALVLFNSSRLPGFPPVSVPLVVGTGITLAASFFIVITFAIRAQKLPVQTGSESLPGKFGITRTQLNPYGQVQVGGEVWSAVCANAEAPIEARARIEVISVEGLRLRVRRKP